MAGVKLVRWMGCSLGTQPAKQTRPSRIRRGATPRNLPEMFLKERDEPVRIIYFFKGREIIVQKP